VKKIEYTRMAEREKNYWWHTGRLEIIRQYLKLASNNGTKKETILNVGCGTGGTLPTLEKFGKVTNVDVSDDAILFMKELGYKVTKVDGIELPYKNDTYSMVCAFDVLEHIDEDVDALKEWFRVLQPGGKVVLTVPAYQWLWSDHDVSLHHHRRHTVSSIKRKAREAGLRPAKVSYAIAFSLPLVAGFRALNKLTGRKVDSETSYVDVSPGLNKTFHSLLAAEAKGHKKINFPFGTSVVAILEKPRH